ncbi:MAG TPA: hypothetical protein VH878_02075 [Thermodesulfobacteriota bacterium]|jgi:hypothetical protein
MEGKGKEIRKHYYYMDKEGALFFEGNLITDPWVYRFFLRSLKETEDGRFLVICENEHCYIEVEDVPYVINDISVTQAEKDGIAKIELLFKGGYKEALDPSTLHIGMANVLYCKVRKGTFIARFNRRSYYHMVNYIFYNDKTGEFLIKVKDKPYAISPHYF